ncbi:MAG: SigB/SigF/SigG family RNA polymerase sigma factor [Armatimonadota bacterium]
MTPVRRSGFSEGSEDQVAELFKQYRQTRDPKLRDQLVQLHMSLARFLASKFANRGEPIEDLVQVATIGLINAVDRYDPDRGTKFSTYATPTIMGEIKRYFRDKSWNLKVPRHLQELNWSANKAVEELTQELGRSPSIAEIAQRIGATEEETVEALELGNAHETVSLDLQYATDGELSAVSHADMIGVHDADLKRVEIREDLRNAIEQLDPREQAIIKLRFSEEDMSQAEVARRLNISQMHVSRLQHRAIQRLRQILTADTREDRTKARSATQ